MRRLALSLALLFALSAHAHAEILKIGVIGPMSGQAAQWGIDLARGAELKAEEINAGGGLQVGKETYTLQIIPYDHKASAAEAVTVTNKLVFQDGVKYIVGNAIGSTTTAAQTITEPNKVIFMFISYGTAALAPRFPYSFRTDLSDVEVVEPFYRWLTEKNPSVKRVAFLNPNDQSGKGAGAQLVAAAKSLALTVVADEYYDREAVDFYPLITRVLAQKPDLIDMSASVPGSAGLIAKQLHEMGFQGIKAWISGVNSSSLLQISGKAAAEGVLSPWSSNLNGSDTPASVKEFGVKYLKKYGQPSGSIAVSNYAALDVLTQAMKAAGSVDTERVMLALESRDYNSVWGRIVVGGKETYGINRQFLRPLTITQIKNGVSTDVGIAMPRDLAAAAK